MTSNARTFIDYLSGFDQDLQLKLVNSFMPDGNISSDEANQIKFLSGFSHQDQVQMIDNSSFANFDWDGDGMCNYFEQAVNHSPYDVYNGRYALLIDTATPADLPLEQSDADCMYNFLVVNEKVPSQNVIKLTGPFATITNFKSAVLNLSEKVSKNDFVYIALSGHGNFDDFGFNDGNGNCREQTQE